MNRERRQRTAVIIGFAVVFGLFAWGTLRLFLLRFEAGDIYPEYSSLRTDPLGTKAFYEALGRLPGITTRRHRTPLRDLAHSERTTLLFLGAQPSGSDDAPKALVDALESVAIQGGRVVLAFYPYGKEPWHLREREGELKGSRDLSPGSDAAGAEALDESDSDAPTQDETESPHTEDAEDKSESGAEPVSDEPASEEGQETDEDGAESREDRLARYRRTVDLADRWGISTGFEPLPEEEDTYRPATGHRQVDLPLPETIPCHSALYFRELTGAWTALYARDSGNAVLVERQWGGGSLVLCADAFLFSNEAMLADRRPELLAWFVGPCGTVVFDETHLGVAERQGVMTLARKYRLHGVLAALAVLALLFVWKNAVSLVPRRTPDSDDDTAGGVSAGRDAAAGLANLLRRSVSPGDLPSVCLCEYEKSLGHGAGDAVPRSGRTVRSVGSGTPRLTSDQINRMRAVVAEDGARTAHRRGPVQRYRDLCRIANERNPGRTAAKPEPARRTTEEE